jgi:hypothetical protein
MADGDDPPRKLYGLKAKEFETVNTPTGQAGPSAAHDVFAIRREVEDAERAAGLHQLEVKIPQRSRRKRDFWLLVAGILIAFGGVVAWQVSLVASRTSGSPEVVARILLRTPIAWWGLTGAVVILFALSYVMFFVMDDY